MVQIMAMLIPIMAIPNAVTTDGDNYYDDVSASNAVVAKLLMFVAVTVTIALLLLLIIMMAMTMLLLMAMQLLLMMLLITTYDLTMM
jgi:hypothetical protein